MALSAHAAPAPLTPQQTEFFEKKIRPVLVQSCYKCHSTEGGRVKGGLRVDTREGLIKGGGSGPALVPGNPEASLLIRAVRYREPDLQMPPENNKLPASQIADLEAWVRMGAPDPRSAPVDKYGADTGDPKKHWAFQPVFKPIVPAVRSDWAAMVRNPLDNYVFATLESKGLAPAPRADKVTLIRRATFNLTGLPPTLADVDAFLADESPQAFEQVVDRLLKSSHYGERWARHWLDVARYADTNGRRANRGDNRFVHSHTYRDWVIQSFNEDLPFDQFVRLQLAADRLVEGEDKQPLAALGFLTLGPRFNNNQDDIIDDRIDVVTKGFLGLTVSCARCHDHKFDPVPTLDYYALHGVFASSVEPREGVALKPAAGSAEHQAYLKALAEAEEGVQKFDTALDARARGELVVRVHEYLLVLRDFSRPSNSEPLLALAQRRNLIPAVVGAWKEAFDNAERKHHPVLTPWTELVRLPEEDFSRRAREVLARLRAGGDSNRPVNAAVVRALSITPDSFGQLATNYGRLFYDVSQRWYAQMSAHEARKRGPEPPPAPTGLSDPAQEEIRRVIYDPASPAHLFTAEFAGLAAARLRRDNAVRTQRDKLQRAVDEIRTTHPGAPPRAVVLLDAAQPRDSYVYVKGNRGSRGPSAPRQFLEILSDDKRARFQEGSGRRELAEAIATPENPLTARVLVNRLWLHQFGEGIVRTPNDFGLRAEPPTHPELLDYLAWNFMDSGWSIKKLQRLIILSHTWQQSSEDNPRFAQADPDNRWLWQQNRRRLDFESLRDTILYIGGKLDLAMGGVGERLDREPYSDRRSIYGFVDRANLPNLFPVFDFPNPDLTAGQRSFTIVPQQALFMMNSQLVLEQAMNTVQRGDLKSLPSDLERVRLLYRLIYSRVPTETELRLALTYLAAEWSAPKGPLAGQPPWEYGVGTLDPRTGRIAQFWPLIFNRTARHWQGGVQFPDNRSGNLHLTATGGQAGMAPSQLVIRRWVAMEDALVSIEGPLAHTGRTGDGVQGRVIYSGAGQVGYWVAQMNEVATNIPRLRVAAGETVDFVVDCRSHGTGDTFRWSPVIRQLELSGTKATPTGKRWSAEQDFAAPSNVRRLYPWEKLAQVLLETNELAFVN